MEETNGKRKREIESEIDPSKRRKEEEMGEKTGSSLGLDVNSFLQNLAAQKQLLEKQLQSKKKEQQKTLLLKNVVERKQQEKLQKQKEVPKIKKEEKINSTTEAPPKEKIEKPEHEEKPKIQSSEKQEKGKYDKDRRDKEKDRDKDKNRERRHDRERHRSREREHERPKDKERDRRSDKKNEKPKEEKFIPPPLLLDEKGREIDEKGNLIVRTKDSFTTLKANQKHKVKTKLSELIIPGETQKKKTSTTFFDPNLKAPKLVRPKRSFNFLEAGHHIKRAEKLRAKVSKEEEETLPKVEEKIESKEIPEHIPKISRDPIPEVEWWDKFLLPNEKYIDLDKGEIKLKEITIYVEHPVPIKPPGENKPVEMTTYLTKKEQKKLRRAVRQERDREKRERVLLGLEEPPKPKVKISNLMKVLGSEAVQDPTQIEQEVKRQMAERQANHEARNQQRKLNPEQKKEKKKAKWERDRKKGTFVALFRVDDLTDPRMKFKVDATARKLLLTGCVVLYKNMNMIIVEGGPKAVKKFKKLMLNRIDWSKRVEDEKNEEDSKTEIKKEEKQENENQEKTNKCVLVWEGTILKPNFATFRFEALTSEEAIRKYLNRNWSEHYLDMCLNYKEEKIIF